MGHYLDVHLEGVKETKVISVAVVRIPVRSSTALANLSVNDLYLSNKR